MAEDADALQRRQTRRLIIIIVMIAAFFVVELVSARIAKSDVLEADAFHLLMDVLAIAISLGALRVASRRPSARFTFGLRRAESLAAMANGVLVLGLAIELVRHGVEHLQHPETPSSGIVLIVAVAALVVNVINAWLLHGAMGHAHHGHSHGHAHGHDHGHARRHAHHDHGHDHDHDHDHGHDHENHDHEHDPEQKSSSGDQQLNLRGAWLHLLGDALGSVAAFISGLAIRFGAPSFIDPLASLVVVAILVIGAVRLLRDATVVLLEAAPAGLAVDKVEKLLLAHKSVESVHSLHVWSLGSGHDAITAHVRAKEPKPNLGASLGQKLREKFKAEYVTVQVDPLESEHHDHDHCGHDHGH